MNFIESFRKRHEERFIRRLRRNPVCKYHKGCTCIQDFLVQLDVLDKFLESKPVITK